jgi:hypothetical protein
VVELLRDVRAEGVAGLNGWVFFLRGERKEKGEMKKWKWKEERRRNKLS